MAPFVKEIEVVIRERGTVVEDRCLSPNDLLYSGLLHKETPFSLSAFLAETQEGQEDPGLIRAP